MRETLFKNGTAPVSSQQQAVYDLLFKNNYSVELNYPHSSLSLDILLTINDIKIDIEYDGSYWHTDPESDRRRDEFLKSEGYKIFRIRSQREIPTLEQLQNGIDILTNTDKKYYHIELNK